MSLETREGSERERADERGSATSPLLARIRGGHLAFMSSIRQLFLGVFVASVLFTIIFRLTFNTYDQLFTPVEGLFNLLEVVLVLYFLPKLYDVVSLNSTRGLAYPTVSLALAVSFKLIRMLVAVSFLGGISTIPLAFLLPFTYLSKNLILPEIAWYWFPRFLLYIGAFIPHTVLLLSASYLVLTLLRSKTLFRGVVIFFVLSGLVIGKLSFGDYLWYFLRFQFYLSLGNAWRDIIEYYGLSQAIKAYQEQVAYGPSSSPYIFLDFINTDIRLLAVVIFLHRLIMATIAGFVFVLMALVVQSLRGERVSRFFASIRSRLAGLLRQAFILETALAILLLGLAQLLLVHFGFIITSNVSSDTEILRLVPSAILVLLAVFLLGFIHLSVLVEIISLYRGALVTVPRFRWFNRALWSALLSGMVFVFISSAYLYVLARILELGIWEYLAQVSVLLVFATGSSLVTALSTLLLSYPAIFRLRNFLGAMLLTFVAEVMMLMIFVPADVENALGGWIDPSNVQAVTSSYADARTLESLSYWWNFQSISELFNFAGSSMPTALILGFSVLSMLLILVVLVFTLSRLSSRFA